MAVVSRLSQLLASLSSQQLKKFKDRFWSKVDVRDKDDCWPWLASVSSSPGPGEGGYGRFVFSHDGATTEFTAHAVASELFDGPIPEGFFACHSCDTRYKPGDNSYRRCCNPKHVWRGTHKQNLLDASRKRRSASGDRSGPRKHPERILRGKAHPMHLRPERRARGERHGNSVLNEDAVVEIRTTYRPNGHPNQRELAEKFSVEQSLISQIVRRKIWTHIR